MMSFGDFSQIWPQAFKRHHPIECINKSNVAAETPGIFNTLRIKRVLLACISPISSAYQRRLGSTPKWLYFASEHTQTGSGKAKMAIPKQN